MNDALGGIASAEEGNLFVALAEFAGDVDEKAAGSGFDAVVSTGQAQHRDAVFKRCAVEMFVGIDAGHDADEFVDVRAGGVEQCQMGSGERIKRAGEDADVLAQRVF